MLRGRAVSLAAVVHGCSLADAIAGVWRGIRLRHAAARVHDMTGTSLWCRACLLRFTGQYSASYVQYLVDICMTEVGRTHWGWRYEACMRLAQALCCTVQHLMALAGRSPSNACAEEGVGMPQGGPECPARLQAPLRQLRQLRRAAV